MKVALAYTCCRRRGTTSQADRGQREGAVGSSSGPDKKVRRSEVPMSTGAFDEVLRLLILPAHVKHKVAAGQLEAGQSHHRHPFPRRAKKTYPPASRR